MAGYLYCLHNEVFNYYGKDVYKLGRCVNLKKRLANYTTPYIHKPIIKAKSKLIPDYVAAENALFLMLQKYRVEHNREFFQCRLSTIKGAMKRVEDMFSSDDATEQIDRLKKDCKAQKVESILANLDGSPLAQIMKDKPVAADIEKINNFSESTTYLADPTYNGEYLQNINQDRKREAIVKRNKIVKKFIELFFDDLLDKKQLKVYTTDVLSDKETEFITKHLAKMRTLFNQSRKKAPTKRVELLSWLDYVLKEHFGGFVKVDKSVRMHEKHNNSSRYYHLIKLDVTEYLELICDELGDSIDKPYRKRIKTEFGGTACIYRECHGFNTIGDILKRSAKKKNEK